MNGLAIFKTLRDTLNHYELKRMPKILDYGCGWGRITRLMATLSDDANVHGVDVDSRLIASANECASTIQFSEIESMGTLPFDTDYLDLAFANSVFSHLSEVSAIATLGELTRVLSPDGLLIVSVLEHVEMEKFYKRAPFVACSLLTSPMRKGQAHPLRFYCGPPNLHPKGSTMTDDRLSFKEMCAAFDVTPRTLRYYEYIELLQPDREGRSRFYGARERARMKLIMRGRKFGFQLEDIRQWLLIYENEGTKAQMEAWIDMADGQLKELAEQRVHLEEAITELQALRENVAAELTKP